jgi:hypothetical protein
MAVNKLRQLDSNSAGVTIPKDDLRLEGLIDDEGNLDGEHHAHIRREGDREWIITLVDDPSL